MNRPAPAAPTSPAPGVTAYFAVLTVLALAPAAGAMDAGAVLALSAGFHLIALHAAAARPGGSRLRRGIALLFVSAATGGALTYAAWPGDAAAARSGLTGGPLPPYLLGAAAAVLAAPLHRAFARRLDGRGAGGRGPALAAAALWALVAGLFALAGAALGHAGVAAPEALGWPAAARAALLVLVVAHFGIRLADRSGDDPANRASPLLLLGLTAAAAQFLAVQAGLWDPATAAATRPGLAPAMAAGLLAARALLRDLPAVAVLATAAVLAHTPLAALVAAPSGIAAATAVLLVALLALDLRLTAARTALATAASLSPVLPAFQRAADAWLIHADPRQRTIAFPLADGEALGLSPVVPFAEFFRRVQFPGALELLRRLQDPQADRAPLRIALHAPGGAEGPGRSFDAAILHRDPRHGVWLCLAARDGEDRWRRQAERFETLFSGAIVREERLLAVASHELRTPLAILSMLCEELKGGVPWADVETSFDRTLGRMIAIIDDLRLSGGAEGGDAARSVFTPTEMGNHILETFRAAAAANGIALKLALPREDTALQSDYSRIFVALSKLVHNAILHSGGSEIVLGCFLAREASGTLTVTWQVADDGAGLSAESRLSLFEPFGGSGVEPGTGAGTRPGLGLYAARKAIRLMGGDLVLQEDGGGGTRFILTHPARPAPSGGAGASGRTEHSAMTDITPTYPDRSVLLVEDNELVGEITSVRLRKVFGTVHWARTGPEGLAAFEKETPDMLLIDQLLPGLSGSDLIRAVRATGARVPVIGITASTIGSECEELEAAGANLALEKPLSFTQIASLADEFFGAPAG